MTTSAPGPSGPAPEVHLVDDVAALPAILRLVAEHVLFERSDAVVPADWCDRTAALVSAGRVDVFAATVPSAVVGYATLTRELSTWTGAEHSHLDCLYVDAAWRGAGTGRALVAAALVRAAHLGLGEVQWQTPAWNLPAIRFYERLGATRAAKERFSVPVP